MKLVLVQMPCALTSSIMSTEFAQEGNHHCSNLSPTSGDDQSDDPMKDNSKQFSPRIVSPTNPSLNDLNLFKDSLKSTSKSNHSFSIDALVGNTKPVDTTLKNNVEPNGSKSWDNNLIDSKRIQCYYQQLYNQTLSLKHLNHYLYPHLGNIEAELKLNEQSRQHDQLLSYYANLYFQNNFLYQERYLQSLKLAFPIDKPSIDLNSSSYSAEPLKQTRDEEVTNLEEEGILGVSNENYSSPNKISRSDLGVHQSGDIFLNCEGSSGSTGHALTATHSSLSTQSFLYSPLEHEQSVDDQTALTRSNNNYSQQNLNTHEVVTSIVNGSGFYSPYCGKYVCVGAEIWPLI